MQYFTWESWVSRWVVSLLFPESLLAHFCAGSCHSDIWLAGVVQSGAGRGSTVCSGWSPLRWQFLWNLLARSSDSALLLRWAAVSPRFSVPSHRLAFAVADVSSFFSQLPHTRPSSSSWFGSLILANSKYAKACLPGFLQNILGSLCAGLDPLSNSFCSLYPILAGCL